MLLLHFVGRVVRLAQSTEHRHHQLVTLLTLLQRIIDLWGWTGLLAKSCKAITCKIQSFQPFKDKKTSSTKFLKVCVLGVFFVYMNKFSFVLPALLSIYTSNCVAEIKIAL